MVLMERKMHPLRKKKRKTYVNIVPKRIMMKLIFGSFIPR